MGKIITKNMSVVLRAQNTDLLVQSKPLSYLTASVASSSGTLTVESIAGFSVGDYIAIGQIGEEKTEIIRIHASTAPSGSTITLASNTVYSHDEGTPVYVVGFDQVEFSRSTTEGGSKSTLSTISIAPDSVDTIYDDTTNTTGYGYWRFKNSAGSTYSGYSDAIPYAGYNLDTASEIFTRALSLASEDVSSRLTYGDLYNFLNDFVALANAENARWSEAKVFDYELKTIATGDFKISLPSNISREDDPGSILSIHMRDYQPLYYLPKRDWNKLIVNLSKTTLSVDAASIDTTLTLTNSYDFADSGNVDIDGDTIAYTGNTRSTGTLTGVTGIATGGHSSGDEVLQRHVTGIPTYYTFTGNQTIRIWPVADSTVNNKVLYMDYFKKIPQVNSLGDSILLNNSLPAIEYVAFRIRKHVTGGKLSTSDLDYQVFLKDFRGLIERDHSGQPLRVSVQ